MARKKKSSKRVAEPETHPQVPFNLHVLAELFRAAPWQHESLRRRTIEVTIPDLGLREGAILLLGPDDPTPGFMVFEARDDVGAFMQATVARWMKKPFVSPPALALTFEPPPTAAVRAKIKREHLELATPDALPCMTRIDDALGYHRCCGFEVTTIVAIAQALPDFVADTTRCEPRTVRTFTDDIALSLRMESGTTSGGDLLGRLREIEACQPFDHFRRIAIEEELLREFASTLDERDIRRGFQGAPRAVLDIAAHQLGVTLASLDARTLRKVVFEILPVATPIEAAAAAPLVDGLASFVRFLETTRGLPEAGSLLDVLARDAVPKLEARIHAASSEWVPNLAGQEA